MKASNKELYPTILKMAIPSMVESLFVCFAGFIDSLMVSSMGPEAVAAIGLTNQPKFLGYSFFTALCVSVSALIARRFGQKDKRGANGILITALTITLLLCAIISTVFVIFAPQIVRFCGSTPETLDMAVLYIRIIMSCMIFNCIQLTINAAQRGAGNTKITMRTNVTSNTVNIIFNYLLIGGKFGFPALGIRGAAIATVLGTVVACVMSIISVMNSECFINIKYIIKEKIMPTLGHIKNIIKVGYSVFFEQLLFRVGFILTALMAASQGTYAVAAHQVAVNLSSLSFAFGDGMQAAAVALVGKSLGEKNPEKAKEYGKCCQVIGAIITVVIAVLFTIFADEIMRLFFKEPEIVEVGKTLVYAIVVCVIFQIRQIIYMGCLRGAGDTLFTATVASVSTTGVRSVVSYICCYTLGLGIFGVWMGSVADQAVRFTLASLRFKSGKWVNIKI